MSAVFTFCYQKVVCSIDSVTSSQGLKTFECSYPSTPCTGKPGTYRLCRTKLATKIHFLEAMGFSTRKLRRLQYFHHLNCHCLVSWWIFLFIRAARKPVQGLQIIRICLFCHVLFWRLWEQKEFFEIPILNKSFR